MSLRLSKGFGLVEAMVAALILAIGLLGMAGLQAFGLRSNQESYLRSLATQLTYDMTDRIRANPQGLRAGNYHLPGATPQNLCMTNSGCTPAQMAQNDAFEWNADVTTQLPSGAGIVCIDGTPADGVPGAPACDGAGAVYAVKVWWQERDGAGNTTTQRFVTSVQP